MNKHLTTADLEKFERAVSDGFAILAGMLAESAGALSTATQLNAALAGAASRRDDPIRDRLLQDAYRIVLIKARNAHPGDPTIQTLYANAIGEGLTKQ